MLNSDGQSLTGDPQLDGFGVGVELDADGRADKIGTSEINPG
jgi:hypothetical protein